MAIENKFPGKDVSQEDIETKFPLVAKKNDSHKSVFTVSGIEFGGDLIPIFAGPNMVESKKLIEDKNIVKDIVLLKSQAERCKEILQRFSKNPLKLKDNFLEK